MMHKLPIVAVAALALLISGEGGAQQPAPPPIPPPSPAPLIIGPTGPSSAAPAPAPSDAAGVPHATQVSPSGPPIVLSVNKGTVIRLPAPANTVFVANSSIADVTIKTPTLIYVSAQNPGETTLYAVDAEDRVLLSTVVRVEPDLTPMHQAVEQLRDQQRAALMKLHDSGIGDSISVRWMDKTLVLSGTVATLRQAEAVRAAAASIAGSVPGSTVLDRLEIATPNQINLHVRIAQVSTTALKELGISLSKTTGRFTFTGLPAVDATAPAFTLFQRISGTNSITAVIDALQSQGLATNLAEPNLTALSGVEASFNVDSLLTIPGALTPAVAVSGGSTAVSSSATSGTQALEFGVKLTFTATVIDAGHIRLKLHPNVSSRNDAGATTINGTVIPEIDKTEADTTVELGSGESFALGGLLQHNTTNDFQKIPGLGDLPVVGALFRTNRYTRDEKEIVIIVTPYIVQPVRTALASPLDGFVESHDVSRLLRGDSYRQTLPAPPLGPRQGGGAGGAGGSGGLAGPVGFRLD